MAVRYGNLIAITLLTLHFFIIPTFLIIYFLSDPNLRGPGIPKIAWWAHRRLTPKYQRWAAERLSRPTGVTGMACGVLD